MRITFLFLLLFSACWAPAQSSSDSLITITRAKYQLECPYSWSVDTSKMLGMDLLIRSPKTDSLDDFVENLNVFIQDLHGQHYDLSQIGKESEAQIQNLITDFQILVSKLDSTASPAQYILKYKGRQGKFNLTAVQHFYLNDEIGYVLTFVIKQGQEERYIPQAEKIFQSFKFRK